MLRPGWGGETGAGSIAVLRVIPREASTPASGAARLEGFAAPMRRFLLLLVLVLILAGIAGFLMLGAFPPDPAMQPVERVLPNERFQTR